MPNRKTTFAINEYYHVYNRGNNKQIIFKNNKDFERFIKLLYIANSEHDFKFLLLEQFKDLYSVLTGKKLVVICAWVLMNNHFHLIVKEIKEGGISKFMQKLSTAFSMYFNKKYDRTGVLFEGRFRSKHLSSDNYLKYATSYVHLNPVDMIEKNWKKTGIKDKNKVLEFLRNYKYSSYQDYIEIIRPENIIVNIKELQGYFKNKKDFEEEIFDWLGYKDDSIDIID